MSRTERYESDNVDAAPLGKPLKFEFSGKTAPNRFLKGAMTERISSWDPKNLEARGVPSTDLVNAYRRWGEGGIGLILSGNIMIDYDQLEAAGNPIIPKDAPYNGQRFERFRDMATQGKAEGNLMVGQVSHPGRQVEERIQKDPVSASDIQLKGDVMGMKFAQPHAASEAEIADIIERFAHAAEYLEKAGWDGIELHGAHGYLLAQFLAPSTNQRTDKYGGSLENRSRLILEIAQAIRKRTRSDFILGIKLNSVEFQDKGFEPEEAKKLCALLEENRFDFVELSGGTYESLAFGHKRDSTKKREAFFLEFADLIAPVLSKTKTYVTGGFKTVGAMVSALDVVDGVGLARPLAQEPRFCKDVLSGKIKGAIKQQFDENDFGITNVAAGTHIRQIGKDHEPIDLSKGENVEAFKKDMGAWGQKLGGDKEMKEYGYVDITSSEAVPYGTAAASL
jgi:2,4-dienoyl-CoA reductase-like NADH-dependent reductase (Old Yellow Enzyme family)